MGISGCLPLVVRLVRRTGIGVTEPTRVYVLLTRGGGDVSHIGTALRYLEVKGVDKAGDLVLSNSWRYQGQPPTLCGRWWGDRDSMSQFPHVVTRICQRCERKASA